MGNSVSNFEELAVKLEFSNDNEIINGIEKYLNEFSHNINAKINYNNDTILHFAVSKLKYKVIEYLLEQGSDVNIENNLGLKPIDLLEYVDNNIPEYNSIKELLTK